MDTTNTHWTQHAQGLGVMTPIDQNSCPRPDINNNSNSNSNSSNNNQNKRNTPTSTLARPQKDQALNCPRCNSTNTKFCYYNNYSLSQPRYFCKTCRRYWTDGGSLRNVPVGGGSRKNRRPSSSSSSSSSSSKNSFHKLPDDLIINTDNSAKNPITTTINAMTSSSSSENPKIVQYEASHDLNLAYPPITTTLGCSSSASSSGLLSLGPFITTITPTLAPSSHDHHSNTLYASGGLFPLLEFKPTLNFSLDGFDTTGFVTSTQTTTSIAATAATRTTTRSNNGVSELEQNKGLGGGSSTGYWNAAFP